MPYIAPPRGGADRIWDTPVSLIDDPTLFDPFNPINDGDKNKYKFITDTLLYALIFYLCFRLINKKR